MKQKNKELLLKDLCGRLPYGVRCSFGVDDAIYEICGINPTCCGASEIQATHIKSSINGDFLLSSCKPYLLPLSSITIEQEKELSKLGVSYGEYALHDDIRGLGIMVDEAYIFFEFCYKHHIDFLGLIEMGLAIDATGKKHLLVMINFDELAKNYIEILDDLLEQDEDIEVNSVNELIEKFNEVAQSHM